MSRHAKPEYIERFEDQCRAETAGRPQTRVDFSKGIDEFPGGAIRGSKVGKGRFDLIPPEPEARLALVYEAGRAHGERNWEQGLPVSGCLSSCLRHINQYKRGMKDEDHLAQAIWNLYAIITTEERAAAGELPKELLDLPFHKIGQKEDSGPEAAKLE